MDEKRTDFVQLDDIRLRARRAQGGFGGLAVGAVGLAEDGDGVVVDDLLRFGLGGRHCGWTGAAAGGAEELA